MAVAIAGIGLAVGLNAAGDGGTSGVPSSKLPFVGPDLHSLIVDPANPSRLFVGGHEGVAVSTNRGKTWAPVDSLEGADAMGWAFTDDAILVSGHPGVSRSEDDGQTFERSNAGLPSTDVHSIGAGGGVVYGASPQVGVFASLDGGQSWQLRTSSAGQSFIGRMLVDATDPSHVVAPDAQRGAVESIDGGRTWHVLGGTQIATWVSWDPADLNRIVASGPAGAAMTEDGGRTWRALNVPTGVVNVEIAADRPGVLFAAQLVGDTAQVWRSDDGGAKWNRI